MAGWWCWWAGWHGWCCEWCWGGWHRLGWGGGGCVGCWWWRRCWVVPVVWSGSGVVGGSVGGGVGGQVRPVVPGVPAVQVVPGVRGCWWWCGRRRWCWWVWAAPAGQGIDNSGGTAAGGDGRQGVPVVLVNYLRVLAEVGIEHRGGVGVSGAGGAGGRGGAGGTSRTRT